MCHCGRKLPILKEPKNILASSCLGWNTVRHTPRFFVKGGEDKLPDPNVKNQRTSSPDFFFFETRVDFFGGGGM